MVSQSLDYVPSDLRQYGIIKYDLTPKGVVEYKKKINSILGDIRNDPDRSDNPISDYLHSKSIVTDTFEAKSIEKKLLALVSESSYNLEIINSTLEMFKPANENIFPTGRFHYSAIELLVSTYYIYPDNNYIKRVTTISYLLRSQNRMLDLMKENSFRNEAKEDLSKKLPILGSIMKGFMIETYKLLNDFRNQNFIEPSKLSIIVSNEEHRTDLDKINI